MIDVWTVLHYEGKNFKMFGQIDVSNRYIKLHCPGDNVNVFRSDFNLFYPSSNLEVFDIKGSRYSVYQFNPISKSTTFTYANVITFEGYFNRLICEENFNILYSSIQFSFEGIENVFPFESFETSFEDSENRLSFVKEPSVMIHGDFFENIKFIVKSDFPGAVKSDNLTCLNVMQKKVVCLIFNKELSVDDLLCYLNRVKRYFEFVLKQEVRVNEVLFENHISSDSCNGILLGDCILCSKTNVKPIPVCKIDALNKEMINNLSNWLLHFDQYEKVIYIWSKTIYNSSVSKSDLFVWHCQALETLCQHHKTFYRIANRFKEEKNLQNHRKKTSGNINLVDILNAAEVHFTVSLNGHSTIFNDIKTVRDYYIHNNPNNQVTEKQILESFVFMEDFFIKIFSKVIGLNGINSWPQRYNPLDPYRQYCHEKRVGLVDDLN